MIKIFHPAAQAMKVDTASMPVIDMGIGGHN